MRRAAAAATWAVLAVGCEQPRTELIARVDSELAWGARQTVQAVTLTVRRGGPTGALRSARTTALGTGSDRQPLPLTVGILPGDDLDTPVWIEALGCADPNGCDPSSAVVAQRAVVRFTRGRTEEVPLLLASACVGATCGSDERCGEGGRCEPATRAMVRPFDGIDAGTVIDAAQSDQPTVGDASVSMDAGTPDIGPVGTCPSGMALVPSGTFMMGSTLMSNKEPVHPVRLTAYCLDVTEVTVSHYGECTASGCTSPSADIPCNWGTVGRETHPVNCVDWNQAMAYCQWRGGDLPTEAQWEYAARGTDGRIYPWGNEFPDAQLCWQRNPTPGTTCPVGMFAPTGVGIFDLAGNVWEWCRDWHGGYASGAGSIAVDPAGPDNGSNRVIRGGSWSGNVASNQRATFRYMGSPVTRGAGVGFRCVHRPAP